MHTQAAAPTLLEDWQARRHRLLNLPEPGGQLVALHVQVLEYLITRYEDAPEAARPARYPLEPSLYVNDRAIIVHHHIWQGKVGGVKTEREAHHRVSTILNRMSSETTEEDREREWITLGPMLADPVAWHPTVFGRLRLARLRKALRSGRGLLAAIEAALATYPLLPRAALEYLHQCLADPEQDDLRPAHLLFCCESRSALGYTVLAWRDRLVAGANDAVGAELRAFFCRAENRTAVLDKIRERLADPHASVRLAAIDLIREIGVLDDVGLLSDLLALPPQPDEHPHERDALVAAMQRISWDANASETRAD